MDTISLEEVRQLKLLHRPAGRKDQGRFLVEGVKGVSEAPFLEEVLITNVFLQDHLPLIESLSTERVRLLSDRAAKMLGQTAHTPGIFGIARLPNTKLEDLYETQRIACLVDINDPGNLGTMIRTADWFGVQGVLLSEKAVDVYNEKVVRSTMGSLFHLHLYQSTHIEADLEKLKEQGFCLVATDVHGTHQHKPAGSKTCIIMGSESHGLSPEILAQADQRYTIPGKGQAESLNVAVSFGITLYDLFT